MPRFVYVKPGTKLTYVTSVVSDPNVPAGYRLTNTQDGSWMGVDGVTDDNSQRYVGGVNSGGYPAYAGDPATATSKWPNGHLGGD